MGNKLLLTKSVFYGENSLDDAASSIAALGRKALIVTDSLMVKLGTVKAVCDMLDSFGTLYDIYDGVSGEPTDIIVDGCTKAYLKGGCDYFIAVGGGSPIDTMKAAAVCAVSEKSINDYSGKLIDVITPPMAAIPTTSGTGSETTQFTIITNTEKDIKMLLKGESLMPDIAVIDPLFTVSAPPFVTAATGLDALCHASESYTSRKAQPFTDDMALSAIRKIFAFLPAAFSDGKDMAARAEMSLAAFEAGVAFNNASVTIIHGMSRPIGALFHVPHGISNAMLLDVCFSYVYDGAYKRFADMARAIGKAGQDDSDKIAAEKFIDACRELCSICKIPTLEEYGINKKEFFDSIDKMAEDAFASGSPSNTIKEITVDDIKQMYKLLWK